MRSMFEHMITTIVMVILLFVFSTIGIVQLQIMTARKIHTSAINQIQSSYYTVNLKDMNESLHEIYPGWNIEMEELNSVNSRKDYLVTLYYDVKVPIFNVEKKGILEGFAR